MKDLFSGSAREQEARIDYLLGQRRAAKLEADKNKRMGFDDKPRLFFKKMHYLNPQSYGFRVENYVKEKVGLAPVDKHEERGDSCNTKGAYFEGKVSYKTTKGEYNFIQIRLWHDVHGYFFVAIDPDDNYDVMYFYLTKSQMMYETYHIGNLAHKTAKSIKEGEEKEYKVQIKEGTVDYNRWLRMYRVPNFGTFRKILTKKPFEDEKRAYYGRKYYKTLAAVKKRASKYLQK
jgi:hypothetical protein